MKRPLALVLVMAFAACGDDSGAAAEAWILRLDDVEEKNPPDRVIALAGGGIEVKAGANATLWHPTGRATGTYRLSMQVITTNTGLHAHGAGLVFGGTDVQGPEQAYTYFLVRGDGAFLVKTRDADDTEIVCEWTKHGAVGVEDDQFTASNRLEVEVGNDSTRFLINGKQVYTARTSDLHTHGRFGGRLVHDLQVRFEGLRLDR